MAFQSLYRFSVERTMAWGQLDLSRLGHASLRLLFFWYVDIAPKRAAARVEPALQAAGFTPDLTGRDDLLPCLLRLDIFRFEEHG